jgi:hypothetical protein
LAAKKSRNWIDTANDSFEEIDEIPGLTAPVRLRCKPTKLYQPALAFWRNQQIEYWLSVPVLNN